MLLAPVAANQLFTVLSCTIREYPLSPSLDLSRSTSHDGHPYKH